MKRLQMSLDSARGRMRSVLFHRRGAFMVLAFFCLIGALGFVTLGIDIGALALEKTRMQNAVDAASMAAAIEINAAIASAGPDVEDVTAYALAAARQKAVDVAALNGTYIDPNLDVTFGQRTLNPDSGSYEIVWGATPANVVKVAARRDNDDPTAPDAKVPVIFAGVFGNGPTLLQTDAAAYVDARDIVAVIDFSGSMNHLSLFKPSSVNDLGFEAIEDNLSEIFEALQPLDTGTMTTEPQYVTVYSPESENPDDPNVDCTFKYDEVTINSDETYQKIKLEFTDGTIETIEVSATNGTYSGSGANSGKDIDTAWVIFEVAEDVTVEGEPGGGCKPTIAVTFNGSGTSVYIESSKDLSNVVLEYSDGMHQKFEGLSGHTGTFAGTGQHSGKTIVGVWVKSGCNASGDGPGYGERFDSPITEQTSIAIEFNDTNENVKAYFDLLNVTYPFPAGSWDDYIQYVRYDSDINYAGYREMYGGITFAHYLLEMYPSAAQTPDLWKTPHYPFHAVKMGVLDLADYLADLGFGDYLGLVSYDTEHRIEDFVSTVNGDIDISAAPITGNYEAIKAIMNQKQAAEYMSSTNIAGGILEARLMLENYGRDDARPTILVMTDGAPTMAEPYTVPSDWDWDELFDYNNDGVADYYLNSGSGSYNTKMSTLVHAKLAADAGMSIHTLSVGNGADLNLMKAIAWLGNGTSTHVPGGLDTEQLREEVSKAFQRLSAIVPPPKLLQED